LARSAAAGTPVNPKEQAGDVEDPVDDVHERARR
jgi:hypothetical protein